MPLVDKLLDQAVLHGCRQVDIIHGIGTGRLQQAVRHHLRQHSMVKEFHSGESTQGGAALPWLRSRNKRAVSYQRSAKIL